MGLISGLLTLPLAPVRGTVWLAEQIAVQAERERDPSVALRRALAELEMQYDVGELSDEEYARAEEGLLARYAEPTQASGGNVRPDDRFQGGEEA